MILKIKEIEISMKKTPHELPIKCLTDLCSFKANVSDEQRHYY